MWEGDIRYNIMWKSKEDMLSWSSSVTFMLVSGIKLFDQICATKPFTQSSGWLSLLALKNGGTSVPW